MSDRCTGHCCHEFTLPYAPEDLAMLKSSAEGGTMHPEVKQIQEMVIYKGRVQFPKQGDFFLLGLHAYTCKHITKDGNCGTYETRPSMCKNYPDRGVCHYEECTWDEKADHGLQPELFREVDLFALRGADRPRYLLGLERSVT